MESEMKLYESLATTHRTKRSRVDIMETFAGNAPVSSRAQAFGLMAATPLDYNTGVDFAKVQGQRQCKRMIDHLKPLVLVQSLHCTPWSLLQDNCNYTDRPDELEQRRAEERPTVKAALKRCEDQHHGGRYYLLENPERSRIWNEDAMIEMLNKTGGVIVKCDSGAYGATNSKGNMIKKGFSFASNDPRLLRYLTKVLSADERQLCVPLEGREVTLSQHYPPALVDALRGIKDVARERNPARFIPKQVYANYSMPSDDMDDWGKLMNQAIAFLSMQKAVKNYLLQPTDALFEDLQKLVPWNFTRVQVSLQPLVFREASTTPHTRRGAALKYVGAEK